MIDGNVRIFSTTPLQQVLNSLISTKSTSLEEINMNQILTIQDTIPQGCSVNIVRFSPQGNTLAVGCIDGTLNIWVLQQNDVIKSKRKKSSSRENSKDIKNRGKNWVLRHVFKSHKKGINFNDLSIINTRS